MADDAPSTVRRRRATATDAPGGGRVSVAADSTTAAATATATATSASDRRPGIIPVLRPVGLQLSPVQGLQVVLQDKDNVSVLSQFIFFSIAVAALPVAVFFLVRRGLSPTAGSGGGPSALVTTLVAAAPRLLTASRVPSLVAALAAVLAVNVVTGAFVLRALVEDARLVAAVGGAPPAVGGAPAEAAAAAGVAGGEGEEGEEDITGMSAAAAAAAADPSSASLTTSATSAARDITPS